MERTTKVFWDLIVISLFAIIFAIITHFFLIQTYIVPDNAMAPDYKRGDIILINRIPYFLDNFKRYDLIVYRKNDNKTLYLRRIIGLPYERIIVNDGILSIKSSNEIIDELPLFGNTFKSILDQGNLDENEFFVLSSTHNDLGEGIVDKRFMIGKPILKLWPLNIN